MQQKRGILSPFYLPSLKMSFPCLPLWQFLTLNSYFDLLLLLEVMLICSLLLYFHTGFSTFNVSEIGCSGIEGFFHLSICPALKMSFPCLSNILGRLKPPKSKRCAVAAMLLFSILRSVWETKITVYEEKKRSF